MPTHGLPHWPWRGARACELPPAERLVLDAARLWAEARAVGAATLPRLRLPCIAEGAAAAGPPLDALLHVAARHQTLAFGEPLTESVLPQEAELLLACGLAQRGARAAALAGLLRLLPLAGAGEALPATMALASALRQAGLTLLDPLRRARV